MHFSVSVIAPSQWKVESLEKRFVLDLEYWDSIIALTIHTWIFTSVLKLWRNGGWKWKVNLVVTAPFQHFSTGENNSLLMRCVCSRLQWRVGSIGISRFSHSKTALSHQGLKSQFKARKPFLSLTFSLITQKPASTKSAKTINFVNFEQRLF
jgi:hypothetical protein